MNKIRLNNITLKGNLALYKLAEYAEMSVNDVIESVLLHLVKLEYLLDQKYECGMLLIEVLWIEHYEVRRFCQNIFKIWTPKLESYLKEIYIWGKYDCPECGCKLHYNGVLGTCSNCGYDKGLEYMPKYKNDCHKELIESINLN